MLRRCCLFMLAALATMVSASSLLSFLHHSSSPSLPTLCSPCFTFSAHGLTITSSEPKCSSSFHTAIVNTSDTSVHGLLAALPLLASPSAGVSDIYVPVAWVRTTWTRPLLMGAVAAKNAKAVEATSHCLKGTVGVYNPPPRNSLNELVKPLGPAYRAACAAPPASRAAAAAAATPPPTAALVISPPSADSGHPATMTAVERFLMRQGVPYEFSRASKSLCKQASFLDQPWKAVLTVDGPHLITLAALHPNTPVFTLFSGLEGAGAYCAMAAGLHAEKSWYAVAGSKVQSCSSLDTAAPAPPSAAEFLENAAACSVPSGQASPHCASLYPLTLDNLSDTALQAIRAALPDTFSVPIKIGTYTWAQKFYTEVRPIMLAKFLSMVLTDYVGRYLYSKPPPGPHWPDAFNPSVCSPPGVPQHNATGKGAASPSPFPSERNWGDLKPTPYSADLWRRLGDPSKPPPRLFIATYNTHFSSSQACNALKTAVRLGYQINFMGYWRSMAFDYMKMSGHFMEDKIWHGMMFARDLTNHGHGNDIILLYDGSDALFQHPPDILMERFLRQNASIFMGVEARCSPVRPPQQCVDYTARHFSAELRDTGLPFGYPNGGLYMGYAWFMAEIFYTCFTVKAEADHRGEKVDYWVFKNSDQKFLYYMIMACPLDPSLRAQIKMDYFQENFGNLPESWHRYSWDPLQGMWHLKPEALGTSPAAVAKGKASVFDRAPTIIHFPGNSKQNYLGWNRMSATVVQGHEGATGPKLAFQCATVHLAEFRTAYVGELCPKG